MLPILLGGGVAAAAYLHYKRRYRPTPPTLAGASTQLQTTAVLPHLGGIPSHYHFWGPHLLYIRSKDNGQLIFAQRIENSELPVPF